MDYINKIKVDGTDYVLSNLTDGTHTVSLPKVNADDEFVVKSTQINKTSQLTNDSGYATQTWVTSQIQSAVNQSWEASY